MRISDWSSDVCSSDLVANGLVPVRACGKHPLTNMPQTPEQAWGCIAEYLSGTAKWEQWNCQERLKAEAAFKDLGVDNLRNSEEGRVGKEGVSACRYRWWRSHYKKKKN